jgi:hypothetical protein
MALCSVEEEEEEEEECVVLPVVRSHSELFMYVLEAKITPLISDTPKFVETCWYTCS